MGSLQHSCRCLIETTPSSEMDHPPRHQRAPVLHPDRAWIRSPAKIQAQRFHWFYWGLRPEQQPEGHLLHPRLGSDYCQDPPLELEYRALVHFLLRLSRDRSPCLTLRQT